MKVDVLAIGSEGNCIALRSEQATILINAGIAKMKIEKRLLKIGISPDEISAIFITHAQNDHIKGLSLANKYRIPIYAGGNEWKSIYGVEEELKWVIDLKKSYQSGYEVQAFKTHHKSYYPLGYAFTFYSKTEVKETKVSICLDTGKVDSEMIEVMSNSDIYIFEANHDNEMVEAGYYPDNIKARILSDVGHLSNEQTADALSKLVGGKGEQIYITHLSSNNNLPKLAEKTVKKALTKKGLKAGKHYYLEVV